jgi:cysteine desulfurase
MIYLDNNATTQIDPKVLEAMLPFLAEHYANPSATYKAARIVKKALNEARDQVASLLNCEPAEIIFTSGGTESNASAIFSALTLEMRRTHFVTSKSEHSAVLELAKRWSDSGHPVTEVDVDRGGRVSISELRGATKVGQTAVVSVMWANNETGVISPIAEAVDAAHQHGALFHTDAVQAVGKLPISLRDLPVDYLTLSGHKIHAPKGIGALFISKRVRFKPWLLGGGQEFGRRSGTENIPGIVALGVAAELMRQSLESGGDARIAAMRDAFEKRIMEVLPETLVNGDTAHRLCTTSSLCFPGVDAAGLLILLDERGVACTAGSACHSTALSPSYVLDAMGFDAAHAHSTVRFSWSRFNTMEESIRAAETVVEAVRKMRSLRPSSGPVSIAE